jgi:hypothetical protein
MKILELSTRNTNGNSGNIQAAGGESIRAQLNISSVSGTTPTLNVLIEDTLDGTNFNTIAAFAQKTAAAREVLNVSTPFSETLRVSWTIAGAGASFSFSVDWSLATRRSN